MEQLKRWREERAARRWRRIQAAGHSTERAAALIVAPPEEPREARRRRFRLWPDPPRVSPVHPAWDDATGGLLKRSFYRAIAVHLVLVPTLLLLSRIDLNLHLPRPSGNARYRVVALYAGRSAGGGHSAARPGPLRPATAPKSPSQNRAEKPKTSLKPKASSKPVGGAVDPRRARPVPEAPPRATTAPGPQPPVEDAGEASTDPEARQVCCWPAQGRWRGARPRSGTWTASTSLTTTTSKSSAARWPRPGSAGGPGEVAAGGWKASSGSGFSATAPSRKT